jgi:hypothetical protein
MKPFPKVAAWATLALALALCAPPALAADPIQVLGFTAREAPANDIHGAALPAVPASAFKFPLTSTEAGPAQSVGLPYDGGIVYVRRLYLRLGGPPMCSQMAQQPVRGSGQMLAGDRAGMGTTPNCIVEAH